MSKVYKYCDGSVLKSVTANLSYGTCTEASSYDQYGKTYVTYTMPITFTLSAPIPVAITLNYQYTSKTYLEGAWDSTETIYKGYSMPAGQTSRTITVTCRSVVYTNA